MSSTERQRHAAWAAIRKARGLGFELRADLERNRIRYRPKEGMPLDLYRDLHEHKAAVLLILDALATVIPLDGKPASDEPCRFCCAVSWLCYAGVWQCASCCALWRPQLTALASSQEH